MTDICGRGFARAKLVLFNRIILFLAIRADAVADVCLGILVNINIHLLPVSFIIPDFLAK